jgi:lactoylglutathione lyase
MSERLARPSHDVTEKLITFIYFVDLPRAIAFYEGVLGLTLEIDQGWSKIFRITPNGYVGLVDEARGSHKANAIKPVQICMRVADVDAWYAYLESCGVEMKRPPRSIEELKIRAFVFYDPEGYQIEIQSVLA